MCHVKSTDGYHVNVESEIEGTDDDCQVRTDTDTCHLVSVHNYRNHVLSGQIDTSVANSCLEYDGGKSSVSHECKVSPTKFSSPSAYRFDIDQCDYGPETHEDLHTQFVSTDDSTDFEQSPKVDARVALNENAMPASD